MLLFVFKMTPYTAKKKGTLGPKRAFSNRPGEMLPDLTATVGEICHLPEKSRKGSCLLVQPAVAVPGGGETVIGETVGGKRETRAQCEFSLACRLSSQIKATAKSL